MIFNRIYMPFCVAILLSIFSSCLKDDDLNLPFVTTIPIDISDGLVLSNPTDEQMDAIALNTVYKEVYIDDNLWSLRSLLVFRNGKLVSEAYLKSESDITTKHLVWSCTKQVVGILTGVAIEKKLIVSVDDFISDYFDFELKYHQDKSKITIRNMITMRSGINYNNDGVGGETDKMLRQIPENSVDFILNLPMNAVQGTKFHYNDGNPHLMTAIIQKLAKRPADDWAYEVFFSKIEMKNYNWVRYKDGVTLGGYGIETTPREIAKIALCVADSGRWKGQQVITTDWITQMTSPHVKDEHTGFSFGYFWWIDTKRDVYFMWGHGGQFAFIVPSKRLVVVMTSIPNTQGDYQIQADEALQIIDKVIKATL